MAKNTVTTGNTNSYAEDLFVQIFCDTFGVDKSQYLYIQHPVVDIYGNHRYIDFALLSEDLKIAIEVDGETYHNPNRISSNKYYDDLLKQNSLIYDKFGEDVKMMRHNEDTCITTVKIQVSPVFFGWLFQFGNKMKILSPESLVREYRRLAVDVCGE